MKRKFEDIEKKAFFGKLAKIGIQKGIGFLPTEEYFIVEETYLFGVKVNTNRYLNLDDYKLGKKQKKKERVVVKGYIKY